MLCIHILIYLYFYFFFFVYDVWEKWLQRRWIYKHNKHSTRTPYVYNTFPGVCSSARYACACVLTCRIFVSSSSSCISLLQIVVRGGGFRRRFLGSFFFLVLR